MKKIAGKITKKIKDNKKKVFAVYCVLLFVISGYAFSGENKEDWVWVLFIVFIYAPILLYGITYLENNLSIKTKNRHLNQSQQTDMQVRKNKPILDEAAEEKKMAVNVSNNRKNKWKTVLIICCSIFMAIIIGFLIESENEFANVIFLIGFFGLMIAGIIYLGVFFAEIISVLFGRPTKPSKIKKETGTGFNDSFKNSSSDDSKIMGMYKKDYRFDNHYGLSNIVTILLDKNINVDHIHIMEDSDVGCKQYQGDYKPDDFLKIYDYLDKDEITSYLIAIDNDDIKYIVIGKYSDTLTAFMKKPDVELYDILGEMIISDRDSSHIDKSAEEKPTGVKKEKPKKKKTTLYTVKEFDEKEWRDNYYSKFRKEYSSEGMYGDQIDIEIRPDGIYALAEHRPPYAERYGYGGSNELIPDPLVVDFRVQAFDEWLWRNFWNGRPISVERVCSEEDMRKFISDKIILTDKSNLLKLEKESEKMTNEYYQKNYTYDNCYGVRNIITLLLDNNVSIKSITIEDSNVGEKQFQGDDIDCFMGVYCYIDRHETASGDIIIDNEDIYSICVEESIISAFMKKPDIELVDILG